MSEQIKRVNRELKFKGTIIDFYQDTMEINEVLSMGPKRLVLTLAIRN